LEIDVGLWSRSLLEAVHSDIKHRVSDNLDPLKLMWSSYEANLQNKVLGSCTACFLSLEKLQRQLITANLGNSSYMLFRLFGDKLNLVHKSGTQEHNYGCPFQLGHHLGSSKPSDSLLASHTVEPGDVIVVGTDGLTDNLSTEEISEHVLQSILSRWQQRQHKVTKALQLFGPEEHLSTEQCVSLACHPGQLAIQLANAAFGASVDKKRVTPFSISATSELNMVYNGGKPDDITVVVAFVELDVEL